MSKVSHSEYTNALIYEASPYLLQHAHNPVQWYPWCESALSLAKQQNKPILLSIGYSACHWCHVMAHESFEDPTTAGIMNSLFINIKVDREERPDLDKIYQIAQHLITQRSGGWPLTMFLNPHNQYPFFGGTYFPPTPRHGLPAFTELLQKIAEFYREHSEEINNQSKALSEAFRQYEAPKVHDDLIHINPEPLSQARQQIGQSFDEELGGFGKAPKFPHLPNIERLFHHYLATTQQGKPDQVALSTALFTLRKMALGGIYDQLGGGFYRYSVDDYWIIPHFEKMLYDNGAFLTIYSEAWQITQEPLFKQVALETAEWAIREMQAPTGGFYSALDADSEGEEGKFYVWTREEVKKYLDDQLYSVFAHHMGLDKRPNFEGYWHLHIYHERQSVADLFNFPLAEVNNRLDKARQILLQARSHHIRPDRDDKILTAWNALMIKGMATAGRIFANPTYLHAAECALQFIKTTLWVNGHLLATKAQKHAYLDDYAFLLDAVLTLLQARWSETDLIFAKELADILLAEFQDTEGGGGFYFTANQHEQLIYRPKPLMDDAIPCGNGIAAWALGRLGHLLGETRYLEAAERTIRVAWASIMRVPYAHNTLLLAVEDYLFPPQIIILRGHPPILQQWQTECQKQYAPQRLCFAIPSEADNLPGLLAERKPQGECVAYVCNGYQCLTPIYTFEDLQTLLQK